MRIGGMKFLVLGLSGICRVIHSRSFWSRSRGVYLA